MPRHWWLPAGALLLAGSIPNSAVDRGQVREATQQHFGSVRFPIEVGPVVVSGNHAIADWTQGEFGGRALFERSGAHWALLLCSGDSVRNAGNLKRAGVPGFNADLIAKQLAEAEKALPPERLKRMRRFVGTAQDHENYLKGLQAK